MDWNQWLPCVGITVFDVLESVASMPRNTQLTDFNRLKMLMAVGSVAYLVALSEGLIAARKRPIKIKRSIGRLSWAAVSIFRYGLRLLVQKMATLSKYWKLLKRLFQRKKRRYDISTLYEVSKSVQY